MTCAVLFCVYQSLLPCRALEASIAENQASRYGLPLVSVFQDPLNPHDRSRVGCTPVGLNCTRPTLNMQNSYEYNYYEFMKYQCQQAAGMGS